MNIDDFRLRTIEGKNVLVSVGETSKEFSGMLCINDSAAELFSMLKAHRTPEKCAELLSGKYAISYDEALNNVSSFYETLNNLCGQTKTIEEVLAENGSIISTTVGVSMYPLLRNRRDNVIIHPVNGRLKKYDVPLYRRGEQYVLHRIIGQTEGAYIIIGDNCTAKETVPFENVIGVAVGFYRHNKYIDANAPLYRHYSRIWVAIFPIRMFYKRCRHLLGIIYRKLRRMIK